MSEVWLITGAAGFIGSNVTEHLLSHGHEVIGLDDLSSGSLDNIATFKTHPKWHFILGDINGPEVENIFNQYPITHVLHLAAIVSVTTCEEEPEKARYVNEQGFDHVMTQAVLHGVKYFMYASSSAVYGELPSPVSESMEPSPLSLYGETKLNNERSAARLCETTQISCVGFRFFNLFGPRQSPFSPYAAVIPRWIHALKMGETPLIFGDGTATRDFCSIQNVLIAIDCVRKVKPQGAHVFNIGTGAAIQLNTLYKLISKIFHFEQAPEHRPWHPGHIVHSRADISLAARVLGYHPKVSLEEGLTYLKLADF